MYEFLPRVCNCLRQPRHRAWQQGFVATEHDITFLFSVGLCLRFGLRPKPRFSKEP